MPDPIAIDPLERTRNAAVLMMAEAHDRTRILRGLDIGVHDYLLRPVDRNELVARVRTQVRRKRLARISHTDIGDCIWRGNPMLVEEVSQCP